VHQEQKVQAHDGQDGNKLLEGGCRNELTAPRLARLLMRSVLALASALLCFFGVLGALGGLPCLCF